MRLDNEFVVPARLDEVWPILVRPERVAPCLPGAQITGQRDDGTYDGTVSVKVGPIKVRYQGTARIQSIDDASHRLAIEASGRESRGQGRAAATVDLTATEHSAGRTTVEIRTDLEITGKVAQFGRNALADVSDNLVGQFAANLAEMLEYSNAGAEAADRTEARERTGGNRVDSEDEPELPLGSVVGGVVARRATPYLATVLLGFVLGTAWRHRRYRRREVTW